MRSNQPPWVPKVEAAIARAMVADADRIGAYREAADLIAEAMNDDSALTQAMVAEHLGHEQPWVSSLLKWAKDGYDPRGPFAADAATRRARGKRAKGTDYSASNKIGPDSPWLAQGGFMIEGGPTDAPPIDQSEATRQMLAAREACKALAKALGPITRDTMMKVYGWVPKRRRDALDKLRVDLSQAVVVGDIALEEVRAALKQLPRRLDDEAA